MPLGTEVGLSPCHVVLDGDPAPPKGAQPLPPSNFPRCLLWSNGRPITATAEHLLHLHTACLHALQEANKQ